MNLNRIKTMGIITRILYDFIVPLNFYRLFL